MLLLTLIVGLTLIPALVLAAEILAARPLPTDDAGGMCAGLGRLAVVVPAHNEGRGIVPTIQDVIGQMSDGDRLVVVADNCTDDTAAVALAHGAQVLVRDEPAKRGKGYAMAWAVDHLDQDPPDFVLFVDADCRVQPDFLSSTLQCCSRHRQPVQALYLMTRAEGASDRQRVSEFAWRLKNWVRPLGLSRLGWPVQLMGTGMMFPWEVIRSAPLASSNIVEDLKLGLDLALQGHPVRFHPAACVTSHFAVSDQGAESQRQRWIGGHLGLIWSYVPRLVVRALVDRRADLLVLGLDLLVPPISLLVLMAGAILLFTVLTALAAGAVAPLVLATLNVVVIAGALSAAWRRFGRDTLPPGCFGSLLGEATNRLRLYRALARGRPSSWVRTDRGGPD
jgi:cellulose synthase/poly-beta-1,6-N-acetylglucosamine synthase-like glycosyltransferase